MAVDSPWFWVLATLGVALVVAAVVLHRRHGRSPREVAGTIGEHEVLIYLNETMVMEMFQNRGNVPALKRLVEQYTRENAEGRGEVKVRWFNLGGNRVHEAQRAESFEAEDRPITAIRDVLRQLEAADAIVYADFHKGEVHAHRSLVDGGAADAKLSETRMFLSVDGLFEKYKEGDESDEEYLRLRAPYPGGDAHVRVKIARRGVREQDVLPEDTSFRARVLGKVENWDAGDKVLKMWALAVFR
ncbi:hypothetical protein [Saccharothrix luteola]|uniref:hypothetical protein n=1 Tax=Saccharothrix luteola TaxID=2893018 RepID=UPI001E4D2BB0|nr:hypothetical protein [Saccharothrix luteola]MCC8246737.1 hypothetical protein [Saccharothrix luteola]